MKVNAFQNNFCIPFLCLAIFSYTHIKAQDDPVMNYLQQAKGNAEIFNGRMEAFYSIVQYKDLPYYMNANFTEATIVYRNNYYPNQRVRLDLFHEQLIILEPEKLYGIILDSHNVDKVFMYNKTIVWLIPTKESGLKSGYYIHLFEGNKLQLYCKEKYLPQQIFQSHSVINSFEHNVRYYLFYNNKYYPVKNKGSFYKIFPQYKKQINKYVKDNKLNFNQNMDISLTSLTGYCEGLLISMNNQ
jgi:hypothetical protein